jgi:broad specificity phosphatase PhoE
LGENKLKIYAVLHGQTDMDTEGRLQSTTDLSLNERGEQQSLEIAMTLEDKDIDVIMASPEKRSTETAAIIAKHLKLDSSKIAKGMRLNERNYGELENKPISEVDMFALHCWEINAPTIGGEEIRETAIRVMTYMNNMVKIFRNKTLLLIIPANVLRTLSWYFHGLPEYGKESFVEYEFGTVYEFDTAEMAPEMRNSAVIMNKLDPEGNNGKGYRDRVLTQDEIDILIKEMGISLD